MSERPEDGYFPKGGDWNAIVPFRRENSYKLQGDQLLVASVACSVDDAVSYALEISYLNNRKNKTSAAKKVAPGLTGYVLCCGGFFFSISLTSFSQAIKLLIR